MFAVFCFALLWILMWWYFCIICRRFLTSSFSRLSIACLLSFGLILSSLCYDFVRTVFCNHHYHIIILLIDCSLIRHWNRSISISISISIWIYSILLLSISCLALFFVCSIVASFVHSSVGFHLKFHSFTTYKYSLFWWLKWLTWTLDRNDKIMTFFAHKRFTMLTQWLQHYCF